MIQFFQMCGPYGIVLSFLALVLVMIALRIGFLLAIGTASTRAAAGRELGALPFWGVAAMVIGILGQTTGAYKALTLILTSPAIDPRRVAQGFFESFLPAMLGLGVFATALLLWLVLHLWIRKVASSPRQAGSERQTVTASLPERLR